MFHQYPNFSAQADAARLRQRRLNWRMRIVAGFGMTALAGIITLAAQAYSVIGAGGSIGLLVIGLFLVCGTLRQADRRFIAPLQARCQADFNERVEALFGALFQDGARSTRRSDAALTGEHRHARA